LSTKKSIINKDRFKNLSGMSAFDKEKRQENRKENAKSRFDIDVFSNDISQIDINKLISAPSEWNFYSKLPEEKFLELIESIEKNSLLHPVVLWEKNDGYMILSGHNRVRAYKALYEMTKDEKYSKIPAIVKRKDDIDENTAREIIVDTNWIQRQLTTYEKTQSILQKYVRIKSEKKKGEKTRDLIAGQLGISGRMVQNYLSLNMLNSGFFELIDESVINIKMAVLLAKLPDQTQKLILKNKDDINFDVNLLKKASELRKDEEILELLRKDEKKEDELITLKVKIRKDKKEEFMKIYRDWLKTV